MKEYETLKAHRQRQQLCKDFLRMKKGALLDAMEARRRMNDEWGVDVDHHEFSDALEYLVTQSDEATRQGTGPDRMTLYLIN